MTGNSIADGFYSDDTLFERESVSISRESAHPKVNNFNPFNKEALKSVDEFFDVDGNYIKDADRRKQK